VIFAAYNPANRSNLRVRFQSSNRGMLQYADQSTSQRSAKKRDREREGDRERERKRYTRECVITHFVQKKTKKTATNKTQQLKLKSKRNNFAVHSTAMVIILGQELTTIRRSIDMSEAYGKPPDVNCTLHPLCVQLFNGTLRVFVDNELLLFSYSLFQSV